MRQVAIDQVKPGMVLATPIYGPNYTKLLAENTMLDDGLIERIRKQDYVYVMIQEEGTEHIQVDDLLGVKVRQEVAAALEEIADLSTDDEEKAELRNDNPFERTTDDMQQKRYKDVVVDAVESMLRDLQVSRRPIYHPGVFQSRSQLINHSTNVAILSVLIGRRYSFHHSELRQLAMAALFHDVGKLRLDPELTWKLPEQMTEEQKDQFSMHPQMGAVLLQRDVNMDINVTMAVLQHHERQDGKGYPQGIKGTGEEPKRKRQQRGGIHRFAEIIAVANSFDNLIGGYEKGTPVAPPDAVREIVSSTPAHFNRHITELALEVINIYPLGSNVRIKNSRHSKVVGYRGVVSKVNLDNLHRPSVVLLYSGKQRLHQPIEVNFTDDKYLELEFLLDL